MDMVSWFIKVIYILIFKVELTNQRWHWENLCRKLTRHIQNLWDSNQILFDSHFTKWTWLNCFNMNWGNDHLKLNHPNLEHTTQYISFSKKLCHSFSFLSLIFLIFVTSLKRVPTLNGNEALTNLSKPSLSDFLSGQLQIPCLV